MEAVHPGWPSAPHTTDHHDQHYHYPDDDARLMESQLLSISSVPKEVLVRWIIMIARPCIVPSTAILLLDGHPSIHRAAHRHCTGTEPRAAATTILEGEAP